MSSERAMTPAVDGMTPGQLKEYAQGRSGNAGGLAPAFPGPGPKAGEVGRIADSHPVVTGDMHHPPRLERRSRGTAFAGGFALALLAMRDGQHVRPTGWRGFVKLARDGRSFIYVSAADGEERPFEPSPDLILNAEWEGA